MEIVTGYYWASEPVDRLTIEIVPLNFRTTTKPQPDEVPESTFRCIVCLKEKAPSHFGDYCFEQKVCKECYPFVDEWTIGNIIKFDRRRGFNYA